MQSIKIKFVDFWKNNFILSDVILYDRLSKLFNIELSETPDYLIYSVFGREHLTPCYDDCIKICYSGEIEIPDFNRCDYGVGFEYLNYGDRYIRIPIYFGLNYKENFNLALKKHINTQDILKQKTSFCSFVVSDAEGNPIRKYLFEKLSTYKKVDSGGKYLNNIGCPNGIENKLEFDKKHKFTIASENASHEGYTTEKIVDAFAAQTIPIYWGDPLISNFINPKAMINVSDFSSLDELLAYIKEIDSDDEKYINFLKQPAFIDENHYENSLKQLDEWLINIFTQPKETAYRRNRGFWEKRYISNFMPVNMKAYIIGKVKSKILHFFKIK